MPTDGTLPFIPGYHPLRMLSASGRRLVYLAVQQSLDRLVVIKTLSNTADSEDAAEQARFRNEALLLAKVAHPNVVPVVDRGEFEDGLFMVLEYVDGETLRELLERDGPLSIQHTRRIGKAVGRAAIAMHEEGIVHRDLKPENVLLDKYQNIRLADFGIAAVTLWRDFFAAASPTEQQTTATQTVEQVGVLPYRLEEGKLEVLLVRAKSDGHWTVPKANRSTHATVAAVVEEEAHEEAGVTGGTPDSPLGSYEYQRNER